VPISYERDDQRRRITSVATGTVTLADVLAIVSRQFADGAWEYGVLYDSRGVESQPEPDEMQAMLNYVQDLGAGRRRGPVALVTSQDDLFRLFRVYSLSGKYADIALDVRAFREMADAERWLDERMNAATS
jgi:hypothetical protein